jgi:hypothetical protein
MRELSISIVVFIGAFGGESYRSRFHPIISDRPSATIKIFRWGVFK